MSDAKLHPCSFEEYNQIPALRSSDLKTFMESPQKYEDFCLLGEQKQKETDAMRLGTILHALVIEGKRNFRIWEDRRVGKDWKQFKAECDAEGVYILQKFGQTDEPAMIEAQIKAVLRNKKAVKILEQTAVREQTILWNHKGIDCKARLDFLTTGGPIADLKTDADPTDRKFFNKMDQFGYHYSAVFYEMARNAFWNSTFTYPFYWIVVSKSPWFFCEVFEMDMNVRDVAQEQVLTNLDRFAMCKKTNNWSDPRFDKERQLIAPEWYLRNNNVDLITS